MGKFDEGMHNIVVLKWILQQIAKYWIKYQILTSTIGFLILKILVSNVYKKKKHEFVVFVG